MSGTAEDGAYEALRRAILEFEVMPGERLSERGLEASLNASRTPIRAALTRLSGEGLTGRAGRGWHVAPIDLSEVRSVMEFRETLEVGVVRRVVERASDAEIRALDHSVELHGAPDDQPTGLQDGSDFHLSLAALAANPFLEEAVASTLTRLARPRWLVVRTPKSRAQVRAEHRELIEALLAREADRAAALVTAHTRGTSERLLAFLAEERARLRGRGLAIVES